MELRDLKKLSDGIVMQPKDPENLIDTCEDIYRKRIKIRKQRKNISLCIIISLLLVLCLSWQMREPEIVVYACAPPDKVALQENETIILAKEYTPMGMGYVLELELPESTYTYTITDEESEYPQNIFHKENQIYWLPDGANFNLQDENGNAISLPQTEKTVINIQVFSENEEETTFQLCLEKNEEQCSVTLTKIDK